MKTKTTMLMGLSLITMSTAGCQPPPIWVNYRDIELVEVDPRLPVVNAIGKLMFVGKHSHHDWHEAIRLKNLKDAISPVCPNDPLIEKFGEQVVSGDCSAALISSQDVLTAAHCLRETNHRYDPEKAVAEARVDFGYTATAAANANFQEADSVISYIDRHDVCCVAACEHAPDTGSDFAILRLAAPRESHSPDMPHSPIVLADHVQTETLFKPYFHPLGLPMKTVDHWVRAQQCPLGTSNIGDFCQGSFDNGATGSGGALLDCDFRLIGVIYGGLTGAGTTCKKAEERDAADKGQLFTPIQRIHLRYNNCCQKCDGNKCPVCDGPACVDDSVPCTYLPECTSPDHNKRRSCEKNSHPSQRNHQL